MIDREPRRQKASERGRWRREDNITIGHRMILADSQ
jgi:hypothetical protein